MTFVIVHLSSYDENSVKEACRKVSELKKALVRLHPDSNLETTLGFGYTITQKWLTEADISFPRSFIEYKEKVGPQGKRMPSTGDVTLFVN